MTVVLHSDARTEDLPRSGIFLAKNIFCTTIVFRTTVRTTVQLAERVTSGSEMTDKLRACTAAIERDRLNKFLAIYSVRKNHRCNLHLISNK